MRWQRLRCDPARARGEIHALTTLLVGKFQASHALCWRVNLRFCCDYPIPAPASGVYRVLLWSCIFGKAWPGWFGRNGVEGFVSQTTVFQRRNKLALSPLHGVCASWAEGMAIITTAIPLTTPEPLAPLTDPMNTSAGGPRLARRIQPLFLPSPIRLVEGSTPPTSTATRRAARRPSWGAKTMPGTTASWNSPWRTVRSRPRRCGGGGG